MTRYPVPLVPAWLRWTGVALVAIAIFVLSVVLAPPEQVVPKPEPLALDKWRHFLAYAALGGALAYALDDRDTNWWYLAGTVFVLTVIYGIGIELGQSLLEYRYFSPGDAYANALGGILALTWYLVRPRLELVPVKKLLDGRQATEL